MFNKYAAFNECVRLEKDYIHVENGGSYYIERGGHVLDVYFEPSNGLIDWVHNFYFPAKPYRSMDNMWFCHRGFLKVWKSIEPYIASELLDPEVKEINIIGYSHGGAIAQFCYEYVKYHRPDVSVYGVGFGSPRVFWGWARKSVRERFKGFVVVRNGSDIVTRLPPVIFGFHHICDVQKIGKKFSLRWIGDHRAKFYRQYLKELEDVEVSND